MGIFRRRTTPPADGVAEQAATLAHAFVTGAAEEGEVFVYDVGDGPRLDRLIDEFVATNPSPEYVHSMVLSMGAYVGELLVRAGAGHWVMDPKVGAGVMSGELMCFPMNKVAKRIGIGPEHSIAQLIEVALADKLPPEAREIPRPGA